MNDGIIKGNGASRYLRSVPAFLSLYPTYEAFAQALIDGTLPVDFNGINEAGWTQLGTALNKAMTAQTNQLIDRIAPYPVPSFQVNPPFYYGSNDYEAAKADGADDAHAGLYAVADSLLGAAVEIGGGIQKLPTELQGSRFTVRSWINTMLDEGKEEVVQGVLSRGLENVVYDKGNAIASLSDENAIFNPKTSAKEFGLGAAVGGILGGAQGAVSNIAQSMAQTARKAQTAAQEGNDVAPMTQNAAEGAQSAALEAGTAVNENGLTAFSEQERTNLSSGKKNKIVSTPQDAVDFIRSALSNKQNVDRAYLGKVPDAVADKVLSETGVNISGYNAVIPGDSVRHMFKRHGDPIVEVSRGQVPLSPELAAKIPEILASPDKVYLSGEADANGRPAIFFEKAIGDKYITVQAVSNGTHSIQTDTLYIRKKTPQDTVSNSGTNAPPLNRNVQNVPPQESFSEGTRPLNVDSTIAQGAENVKTDPLLQLLSGGKRVELNTLFDAQQNAVFRANEDFIQFAIQRLANQIEVFEVYSFGHFVVQFVDGSQPYAGLSGKVGLYPAKLARLPGQ